MAFSLPLPARLANQRWTVKILDKERCEPPHVTIRRKTKKWRVALRQFGFMDEYPDPAQVPKELVATVFSSLERLRAEWDRMYPLNPIKSDEA